MRRLLPPAIAALAAFAVYASTLSHQFVYDDLSVIVANPKLHHLANWREILTSPWWPRGLYRPFTSLTLAANWTLSPERPFGFHLANALMHAAAAAALCVLATRLMSLPSALAAALLFAVHPVHVEAVANVVGRAEVLATLFVLLSVLAYLRYGDLTAERGSSRARALAAAGTLGAAVLALASKESAFALPGILLVADWGRARAEGQPFAARAAGSWPVWTAALLVTIGWLWLRTAVVGELAGDVPAPGLAGTSVLDRMAIMLAVVPQYLRLLLYPARLSAEYSPAFLPVSTRLGPAGWLGLVSLLVFAGIAVAARRRAPVVTVGLAWAAVAILVVGNVLVPSGVVLAERTLYLASAGVCLAAGWLWGSWYARRRGVAVVALGLVLAAGFLRTSSRAGVWRDEATFFPQLVADAPGSYRADWVAAMLAYERGDSASGERLMRSGLAAYTGSAAMWSDFAVVLERQRRWSEAAGAFWSSFSADSGRAIDAARAVGNYVQAGRLDSAALRLEVAERVLPESVDLKISASHLAFARGDVARALALRHQAAAAHPEDWRYWVLTAEAAVPARQCAPLLEALERLQAIRPTLSRLPALRDSAAARGCA